MFSDGFLLGYMSKITGITLDEIKRIASGEIKVTIESSKVRKTIMDNSEISTTLLRNIYNLGVDLSLISEALGIEEDALMKNLDNLTYWLNVVDLSKKHHRELRISLTRVLYFERKISMGAIASIFNIAASTVNTDIKSILREINQVES